MYVLCLENSNSLLVTTLHSHHNTIFQSTKLNFFYFIYQKAIYLHNTYRTLPLSMDMPHTFILWKKNV